MISTNQSGQTFPGLTLKAWARISSAGALIKGFNVTSTSRSGVGTYGVVFTQAMATTTYSVKIISAAGGGPTCAYTGTMLVGSCPINNFTWGYAGAIDQELYVEFWE